MSARGSNVNTYCGSGGRWFESTQLYQDWLRKLAKSPTMIGQSTTTTCRRPGAKLKKSQPRRLRSDVEATNSYGLAPSTAITLYFAYFSPILRAASYSGE